jgi:hypothetical protein
MYTLRFGRKLNLPSTIAIKHQVRRLMAADQIEKAEAASRAKSASEVDSTDILQLNEGPQPLVAPPR